MAEARWRPADLTVPAGTWKSTRAVFDLEGLGLADSAGVLLQWALARHLRGEMARAGYRSMTEFASEVGLSRNRVTNFLNGHRKANFQDLAAMLEVLGPRAWPDPQRLARYVEGARLRSRGDTDEVIASLYEALE